MAIDKQRYVNTRFWNDTYVSELDPIEKLLFMYLLTNSHTNIAGIYELPLKVMSVETGIEISMLKKIIPRLKKKITFKNNYVVMRNFLKHQNLTSKNTLVGVINVLKTLDKTFLEQMVDEDKYWAPEEVLEGAYKGLAGVSNYSDSDSNSDSDLDLDSDAPLNTPTPSKKKIPTLEEVKAYVEEKQNGVDPVKFWNFYESKGWKVGKNPMVSWKACIATWSKDTKTLKKSNYEKI